VNIALNEDLACSYKQSVLSTCSVEGVARYADSPRYESSYRETQRLLFFLLSFQIQVKAISSGRTILPSLRDASMHIASMAENKKFADDISDSLVQ
jgi:hypothetical protein